MKNSIKVGIFAIIIIVMFVAVALIVSKYRFATSGYKIYADFSFISDLRKGAKVSYRGGLQVGYVESLELNDKDMVRVTMIIENEKVKIREGSDFGIRTVGLGLGEKYILITPPLGVPSSNLIKPGSVVKGQEPMTLEGTIESLEGFTKDLSKEDLTKMIKNLLELIVTLNAIAGENQRDINLLVKDMRNITHTIDRVMISNEAGVGRTITKTEATITSLNTTISNLDKTIGRIDTVMARLENGEGTAGKLLKEEEIYEDLKETVKNLKGFSKEVKDNPSSLLFGGINKDKN